MLAVGEERGLSGEESETGRLGSRGGSEAGAEDDGRRTTDGRLTVVGRPPSVVSFLPHSSPTTTAAAPSANKLHEMKFFIA